MATAATISARLILDSSDFDKGLNKAEKRAKGFSSKFASGMRTAGKAAAVGIGIATAAIGAAAFAFGGMIKNATLATARVEELQAVNQVLGKKAGFSSQQITDFAQAIRDEGIQASVAEKTVAEFIRANLDLTKAAQIAKVAQDAAVISGIDSSEATARIIDGITKLNPLILRNAGVIVDLQAGYKKYADQLGISTNDLTTAQKQQVAMNAVLEAGESVAGAYTAAMEKPGKLLRSFPRYFNDIMVSMGGPFQKPFATLLFSLKDLVKWIGNAVAEGGSLRPMLESLALKAQVFADYIKGLVETFIDAGPASSEFQESLTAMLPQELQDKFFALVNMITGLKEGVSGAGGKFQEFMQTLAPFITLISGIGGILLKILMPALSQIASVIGPLIQQFLPPLIEMFSALAMKIVSILLPPLMELATKILPIIIKLFATVIEAIFPLIEAILPPLVDLILMVIDAFLPLIQAILPVLADVITVVIKAITPLLIALLPLFISLIELVLAVLLPVIDLALPILVKLIEAVANALTIYVIPALEKFANWVQSKVVPAIRNITNAIKPAIDWIRNLGNSISNIQLPDWLTPGSPTPFELGLLGINDALKKVSQQGLPSLQTGLQFSPVTAGAGTSMGGSGQGSSSGEEIRLLRQIAMKKEIDVRKLALALRDIWLKEAQ